MMPIVYTLNTPYVSLIVSKYSVHTLHNVYISNKDVYKLFKPSFGTLFITEALAKFLTIVMVSNNRCN